MARLSELEAELRIADVRSYIFKKREGSYARNWRAILRGPDKDADSRTRGSRSRAWFLRKWRSFAIATAKRSVVGQWRVLVDLREPDGEGGSRVWRSSEYFRLAGAGGQASPTLAQRREKYQQILVNYEVERVMRVELRVKVFGS